MSTEQDRNLQAAMNTIRRQQKQINELRDDLFDMCKSNRCTENKPRGAKAKLYWEKHGLSKLNNQTNLQG